MALQPAPEKLKRLNWRERWQGWRWRPQQTGSEYPDKPVSCETGSETVWQPVTQQPGSMPVAKPVSAEPVSAQHLRAFFETISPDHHARCQLAWLQATGYGGQYLASVAVRDNAYPQFCAERGWEPLPWVGRDGVGKHLAELCGGRPIKPDPDAGGKPTRCYKIPAPVVELAAAERKRA